MSVPTDIIRLIVLIKCKLQLSQVSKQYHNNYTLEYNKMGKMEYVMDKIRQQFINYRDLNLPYCYKHIWRINGKYNNDIRCKLPINYF